MARTAQPEGTWLRFLVFMAMGLLLFTESSLGRRYANDCSAIKYNNPSAKSGVYTIQPRRQRRFRVYCDMSESIGWTKILQIWKPYTVTRRGYGNIAAKHCFTGNAKLSDARINAIRAAREKVGEPGIVHYRVTAMDTHDRVYMKAYKKAFNDLKAGWNVFQGSRSQCLATTLQKCNFNYIRTRFRTLDTLIDGTRSGQTRRFFTDHYGGNTRRRCWQINSPKRCVSRGSPFNHDAHFGVELWIGK